MKNTILKINAFLNREDIKTLDFMKNETFEQFCFSNVKSLQTIHNVVNLNSEITKQDYSLFLDFIAGLHNYVFICSNAEISLIKEIGLMEEQHAVL